MKRLRINHNLHSCIRRICRIIKTNNRQRARQLLAYAVLHCKSQSTSPDFFFSLSLSYQLDTRGVRLQFPSAEQRTLKAPSPAEWPPSAKARNSYGGRTAPSSCLLCSRLARVTLCMLVCSASPVCRGFLGGLSSFSCILRGVSCNFVYSTLCYKHSPSSPARIKLIRRLLFLPNLKAHSTSDEPHAR